MDRNKFQEELAEKYIKGAGEGIYLLAPRMGKCRVGVLIMQSKEAPKVLIVYPDKSIKESWEEEFRIMGYSNPNVTFSTNRSLDKHIEEEFDFIFLDECHLLSYNNICSVKELQKRNKNILGLTGTLSSITRNILNTELGWRVLYEYSQEESIEDGIVADYRINIVQTQLDNSVWKKFGKKTNTEKRQFDKLGWIIDRMEEEGKNTFYMRLNRMRIIQSSLAKLNKTKELLKQFKEERVLVFCGLIKIAEQLGIPTHHSKSEDNLTDFKEGKGNHLALIKMGNTGVTFKPLNKLIINYFDSNSENMQQKISRALTMEFEGKIANIYLITTNEPVEHRWLKKALQPFDENKILWV